MDIEAILLGNIEYSVRIMRLIGFSVFSVLGLLHCNASNLVFEILKHDKIWGDNLH